MPVNNLHFQVDETWASDKLCQASKVWEFALWASWNPNIIQALSLNWQINDFLFFAGTNFAIVEDSFFKLVINFYDLHVCRYL